MKPFMIAMLCAISAAWAQGPALFRADTRLVEVYATIKDSHGRYLDGLPQDRFQVLDNGERQSLVAFESESSRLSCAILIDTTGSMAGVLPVVKNSVIHLIDELRDEDSVAIYSFSSGLHQLQDFTSDKAAAKQAVLRTRADGATALFDAISELAHDVGTRSGKKSIVVFTDGADNASVLNASSAIQRAKKVGVPVYTIAEGEALATKVLLQELNDIAQMSGAKSYQVRKTSEITAIFQPFSSKYPGTCSTAIFWPINRLRVPIRNGAQFN